MSGISIRNVPNVILRRLIKKAAKWMARTYIGKHKVKITIKFTNLKERESCIGMCEWVEDERYPYRPKQFYIQIDETLPLRRKLYTLAHEIVHVKQFVHNEMYDYANHGKIRWKGKIIDSNRVAYRNQPWEIEAYKKEKLWAHEFMEANDIRLKDYD
jgi:hypothetical protein